ncbi:MAG: Ig-like domain-containing protein [Candidatus Thorarchaeota archaeon]
MNSNQMYLFLFLIILASIPVTTAQDEGTIIINANLVNEATYNGIHELTVTASHPDGIWYITVNIDGSNVKSVYSSSLTYSWDTTLYSDGAHHIQIRSAVNSTFFRGVDYDVFVNNTLTTPVQGHMNILIKYSAIGMSATVITTLLGFIFFKSNLIESNEYKIVVVIAGVLIFAVIAGYIWVFL